MKHYIGIDIGGTNISVGVVDEDYSIIGKAKVKTALPRPYAEVFEDMCTAVKTAVEAAGLSLSDISAVGIGCPGTCNRDTGTVEYSNNLRWVNVPLIADTEKALGIKTYFDNDANAAALGEFLAGAAKGAKNAVIITLGTGVGAGIIIEGKIYSGSNFAGAEIGHTVIEVDGYECTCGRRGCFEAYSSATGLVRMTREAMDKSPSSKLHNLVETDGKISARTAFNAAKLNDDDGIEVVNRYIKYLACGITNTINVFQPDILCIGGGVCNEGDNLLVPLKKLVDANIYTKNSEKKTAITLCSLGNDAGIIGAAMLCEQ